MIDYNKYSKSHIKNISPTKVFKRGTTYRKLKLTAENKQFLKQIGLLK